MPRLHLRLFFDHLKLGPGKADLLQQIAATGSIAAAGRAMGMSYKRAWMLVEEMNTAFREPLVLRERGGQGGGKTELSQSGREVLALYRSLTDKVAAAGAGEIAGIEALLKPATPEASPPQPSAPQTSQACPPRAKPPAAG